MNVGEWAMWKVCVVGVAILLVQFGSASANVVISIDVAAQRMTVNVDGTLRYTWPVSTGGPGYTTPPGSFSPIRLVAEHYSREWDDAPMPHSIFFTERGHAIHGTTSTASLGAPVSHGCVRLAPDNAALLYGLVEEKGLDSTEVEIVNSAWETKPYESFGALGDRPARGFESVIEISGGR
jgi:lipoprotein-anchoring transpeptidase ErfK/SrfK